MKKLLKIINSDGSPEQEYVNIPDNSRPCIELEDSEGNKIFVGDMLYDPHSDTYFTVFEVPGGYAIESNPKSFGLYDPNDIMPIYESTADRQTASYISQNCVVWGNKDTNPSMFNLIKSKYEAEMARLRGLR